MICTIHSKSPRPSSDRRRNALPALAAGLFLSWPAAAVSPTDIGPDPFEVSPQLREGGGGGRFNHLPGANSLEVQRQVRLKALLVTPSGKAVQLAVSNRETLIVMDGELLDLGGLGIFQVHVERGKVTLSNPSAPQGKSVVLR